MPLHHRNNNFLAGGIAEAEHEEDVSAMEGAVCTHIHHPNLTDATMAGLLLGVILTAGGEQLLAVDSRQAVGAALSL